MTAADSLHGGRGVDVGQRDDARSVAVQCFDHPFGQDVRSHFGHDAARFGIGDVHVLPLPGQDGSGLGHEVHPAEDDVFGLKVRRCVGPTQRISEDIGVADHGVGW